MRIILKWKVYNSEKYKERVQKAPRTPGGVGDCGGSEGG